MKKIYLTTFLLLSIQTLLACTCTFLWPDAAIIQDLSANSDLVVVGHPIKNIDDHYVSSNSKYMGTMILFKVDSIIKGKLTSDTIFINQETMGNCSLFFTSNEKYVIFGQQIKSYKKAENDSHASSSGYSNKTLTFRDQNNLLPFFKDLTKKYYTITTNQCVSFTSRDSFISEYFNLTK